MGLPAGVAEEWFGRICRLKVDRARAEPAPHKPLLLLVFFDMVEAGQISDGDAGANARAWHFSSQYTGSVVAHRRSQPLLAHFPFFHLRSDGFWRGTRRSEAAHREAKPCRLRPDRSRVSGGRRAFPGFRQAHPVTG